MSDAPNKVDTPAVASSCAYPWMPDCGDGTYRNPVIYADYSDPDVVRHGDDFWLTASSFNCTPGLPILHSRDLVNWALVNHALQNVPGERYKEVQPGCGVWAPSIRFHDGTHTRRASRVAQRSHVAPDRVEIDLGPHGSMLGHARRLMWCAR